MPELASQRLRRMVAALQHAVAIGRDERDAVDDGRWKAVDDDVGCPGGEPSQPTLLPRRDNAPHGLVVRDRRTRERERETPPRALGAALYRPCRRRAAAFAERRLDRTNARPAAVADLAAGEGAAETALRQ